MDLLQDHAGMQNAGMLAEQPDTDGFAVATVCRPQDRWVLDKISRSRGRTKLATQEEEDFWNEWDSHMNDYAIGAD